MNLLSHRNIEFFRHFLQRRETASVHQWNKTYKPFGFQAISQQEEYKGKCSTLEFDLWTLWVQIRWINWIKSDTKSLSFDNKIHKIGSSLILWPCKDIIDDLMIQDKRVYKSNLRLNDKNYGQLLPVIILCKNLWILLTNIAKMSLIKGLESLNKEEKVHIFMTTKKTVPKSSRWDFYGGVSSPNRIEQGAHNVKQKAEYLEQRARKPIISPSFPFSFPSARRKTAICKDRILRGDKGNFICGNTETKGLRRHSPPPCSSGPSAWRPPLYRRECVCPTFLGFLYLARPPLRMSQAKSNRRRSLGGWGLRQIRPLSAVQTKREPKQP